jgi:AcrR family transcriptional regulator
VFPLRDQPAGAVASEPGRRERNRQRTHDALHSAAMRLFAEHGYEATSVDDIADAAGVSVRTFFRYFGTKEDVLFARSMDIRALVDALAAQPPSVAPLDAIRRAYHAQPTPTSDEAAIHVLFHRAMSSSPALQGRYLEGIHEFRDRLARTLAARAGRPEATDADVLAATIGQTLLDHALTCWMTAGATGDLAAEVDAAFARLTALVGS